jgi:uncharacterized protein DUF4154
MRAERALSLAGLLLAALLLAPPAAAAPEHQVMAEFIERFTRFVDWPPNSLPGGRTFVIGIVGDSPILSFLQQIVDGRVIKGRRAVVRVIDTSNGLRAVDTCQVVFISASERKNLSSILSHTDGRPILTVADSVGFGAAGVLINFYREDDFLRFEINADAATDSGLKVRAKLLRLARVIGGP